jgi:hypothetical protein
LVEFGRLGYNAGSWLEAVNDNLWNLTNAGEARSAGTASGTAHGMTGEGGMALSGWQ